MSKQALVSGDQVLCKGMLGQAMLLGAVPLPLTGTGHKLKVGGKPVALEGDISKSKLPAPYMAGAFAIPGVLLLQADKEKSGQLSTKLKVRGKKVLLKEAAPIKGKRVAPAMKPNPPPAPPQPDSNSEYQAPQGGTPVAPPGKLKTA
ncbi:hypothetical protein LQR31_02340 [Chromobacterium vaccinii]|uniref:hypothetical protein n=1 Tax=Chromobacterium vaccinii TaxID=1108595 RepID=UPI001E306FA6|nr:hypothetical protein [Chromobacterium vaccinii]MCD4483311.1 hypothetical protein [Chromobacterium vaccinii]